LKTPKLGITFRHTLFNPERCITKVVAGTGGGADNQKGFELAGDVTLLPRLMFNVAYGIMKLVNTTSTLDLGSPALAVVNSVTPTGGAPIVSMVTGAQNKTNQNYVTASVHYMF
jgi:hypothetical protein